MKDLYKSSDFYLSSVLLASGCKLLRLERNNSSFSEFVFDESPEKCESIISSYWADTLSVNPKTLISSINQLKTRLFTRV